MDQKSADAFPVEAGYLGGMIYKTETAQRKHRQYCMRGKKRSNPDAHSDTDEAR